MIDNKVCCPVCKKELEGGITKYDICKVNQKKAFEIYKRCECCKDSYRYFSDLWFEKHFVKEKGDKVEHEPKYL